MKSEAPCLIGRLGSTEVSTMFQIERCNSASVMPRIYESMRTGRINPWNSSNWNSIKLYSGFYPLDNINLVRFYAELLSAIKELDIIGSWVNGESRYTARMSKLIVVKLAELEPYFHIKPWSIELAGNKVFVIHPFANLIARQYQKNREYIFNDKNVLPSFELSVLPAVQTIGGQSDSRFASWF